MKISFISSTCAAVVLSVLFISPATIAAPEKKSASGERRQLPIKDVQRFTNAISQIKNYYVKPVKDTDLFDGAIRGMVSGLDPHSAYLDKKAYKELHESTKGEFSGLGIEVTMENGVIKVISPIEDTPAFKAGIKSGDYIVRIDNKPIKGMSLRKAVNSMRGKRGSKVKLTVIRKGETKPLIFTVVRDTIEIQSVKSKLLENKYGYVRITHFQAPSAKKVKDAIHKLHLKSGHKLNGLIIDLRDNPGGLLDSAIKISDSFIHNDRKGKEEKIVYTQGRLPGSKFTAFATPGDVMKGSPIVVMINGGSASGSEIVAGALKDNKRAIIVGTRSFGKGSVQTVLPLDEDRGIKLTTALYYTPAGTSIQASGIKPDIIVHNRKVKNGAKGAPSLNLKESDLSGHLENGNGKKDKGKLTKADKQLIHKDYQLYQALNLLKGLALHHANLQAR